MEKQPIQRAKQSKFRARKEDRVTSLRDHSLAVVGSRSGTSQISCQSNGVICHHLIVRFCVLDLKCYRNESRGHLGIRENHFRWSLMLY